ncbi:MAG: DUF3015 family protein [SAR324 cluster bacterium]|nr:DUF3015 family protein [SAR324 cluster bacterium]
MMGLVFPPAKHLQTILFSFTLLLFLNLNNELLAACRGEGFVGISNNDPIMSWVDLTYSPTYSSASTSGTSGCKNWDFSQYLEDVRLQFVEQSQVQLLAETVQGHGPHLDALSRLMTCPESTTNVFSGMLWNHRLQTITIFETSNKSREYLAELRKWILDSPELRNSCRIS